jgi:RHS repeat-associated protein
LAGTTENYSYDAIYQLTQVAQGANTTESYSYDGVGNRLSSLGASPYSYNNSNELTGKPGASYTYDNNGNTLTKTDSNGTTSYVWDFENRLVSVTLPGTGGTVTFKYDPFGRRIQKSGPSGTTNYLYDGANILEEVDATGTVLARYTQGPGIDEPLAVAQGGVTSYYQADGLGSVTSLTDTTGALAATYTYDTFGNLTASSGTVTNPYRYTGRELDSETGLYYYRARYYDPQVGRFIAEDPAGFGGGTNKFAYALDNPAVFKDPLGLDTVVMFVWDNPINHAAVYIDDGGPLFDNRSVIYDPGGSWGHDRGCGSGDACTGASLDDYVDYYKRNYPGSKVDLIRFPTTPEEEAQIAARVHRGGGSPGYCAIDTGAVLRGIGPFKDLEKAYLPGGLRDEVLKAHDSIEVLSRNVLRRLTPRPPDSALWPRY